MSTNDAFIKAFRRDAAVPATPAPATSARVRQPAARTPSIPVPQQQLAAGWQTTVEIAAANFSFEPVTSSIAAPIIEHEPAPTPRPIHLPPKPASSHAPGTPTIGKRPLSSFQPQPHREPSAPISNKPAASNAFTPETVISAFRWPAICRSLWTEHSAQYEAVADRLLEVGRAGRPLIGVTSINIGDGCTTTMLCLAAALAARKARLALVDANFHGPQLSSLLGAAPTTTWIDVLDRGLPVAEAMIRASQDHIDLLPLRTDRPLAGHEAAELVAGLQTSVTAGVLRTAYDIVLLDLGALLAPGAYAALSHLLRLMPIDAAIVVTNPNAADAHDAALVGELLDEDGCELLGVVENRAKPQAVKQ